MLSFILGILKKIVEPIQLIIKPERKKSSELKIKSKNIQKNVGRNAINVTKGEIKNRYK